MVFSDFLSRQKHDNSNPHEIIHISFNMYQVLHEKHYDTGNYLVQTRSQTKSSGIKLPEVHGMRKNLDPNILPEKQHANPNKRWYREAMHRSGKSRIEEKIAPITQTIIPPSQLSQQIPGETKIETRKTNHVNSADPIHSVNNVDEGMTHTRPLIPDVPFYPGPMYRPPHKLIRSPVPRSQGSS